MRRDHFLSFYTFITRWVLQLLSVITQIHCSWASSWWINPAGWQPSTRGLPGVSTNLVSSGPPQQWSAGEGLRAFGIGEGGVSLSSYRIRTDWDFFKKLVLCIKVSVIFVYFIVISWEVSLVLRDFLVIFMTVVRTTKISLLLPYFFTTIIVSYCIAVVYDIRTMLK